MTGRRKRATAQPARDEGPAATGAQAVAAAMRLFAERGWTGTTLADIAEGAGLSFATLHALHPSKTSLLRAFAAGIDRAVLAAPPERDASVREALFEIFMRRFDALQPHREALRQLARDLPRDPAAAACQTLAALRSVAAMAERAGVVTTGPLGALRVKALAGLYAWTARIWLADDSADMARTMKALDQGLGRLEALARSVPKPRSRPSAA